jgi:hypothetical protein
VRDLLRAFNILLKSPIQLEWGDTTMSENTINLLSIFYWNHPSVLFAGLDRLRTMHSSFNILLKSPTGMTTIQTENQIFSIFQYSIEITDMLSQIQLLHSYLPFNILLKSPQEVGWKKPHSWQAMYFQYSIEIT